jgi:hypothetical protein
VEVLAAMTKVAQFFLPRILQLCVGHVPLRGWS